MPKSYSISLFFIALLVSYSPHGVAAEDTLIAARRDAQHRINVSGRQRMLSQRMAKTACLATTLSANRDLLQEMRDARTLFTSSMKALRGGSSAIGLAPERDQAVLPLLDTAEELATLYEKAIDQFAASFPVKPGKDKLEAIYEMSLPLLTALNDAVEQLEAKHEDGGVIRKGLANALNVSGRQRMLSQKMSKELCMIALGYNLEETRAHLMGSIALFESSHEVLKRGIGLMRIADKDAGPLRAQLALIERHWQRLGAMFIRVSQGETPTPTDLATVAAESPIFLAELNKAVELYEVIDLPSTTRQTGSLR